MSVSTGCYLALFAFLAACAPKSNRFAGPAPCAGNDTVYVATDPGVTPVAPAYIRLPPTDVAFGTYRLRILIDATGKVVADSTQVLEAPSATGAHRYARTVAESRYRPAVRNGCAVRFRTEVSFRR